MKKTRKAHLWIGLICSIFILMESITGLVMNEPWLIGQSQQEGRGDFQQPPFTQSGDSSQTGQQNQVQNSRQNQSNSSNQTTNQNQPNSSNQANNQNQGQTGNNTNTPFPGAGPIDGNMVVPRGEGGSTGSLMSIIKGLHEGRIGTTNIKWLIDLTALALIFLTGSGIYLSTKVLIADKKRKKRKMKEVIVGGEN